MNGFPPFLLSWSAVQHFLLLFFVPLTSGLVITPFFRLVAHKTGILDIPNNGLKTHTRVTAYLGGVALYVSAALSYFLLTVFYPHLSFTMINPCYFLGLTFLLGVGLIDDIFAISPLQKLGGQCIACVFFLQAGLFFKEPFLARFVPQAFCTPGTIYYLGIILSLWWMLSIINAINLIDIMDGLATTVSFTALLGMVLYGGVLGQGMLLVPFLGVMAGFFLYNKPPASIYLGDAGALFLGGILATVPFIFGWGRACQWEMILAPLLILTIPILELCWLMGVRTYLKIPFYHGSPHHFALYFKRQHWSVKKILRTTGLVGALCVVFSGFVAFGFTHLLTTLSLLFLGLFFLLFICL